MLFRRNQMKLLEQSIHNDENDEQNDANDGNENIRYYAICIASWGRMPTKLYQILLNVLLLLLILLEERLLNTEMNRKINSMIKLFLFFHFLRLLINILYSKMIPDQFFFIENLRYK